MGRLHPTTRPEQGATSDAVDKRIQIWAYRDHKVGTVIYLVSINFNCWEGSHIGPNPLLHLITRRRFLSQDDPAPGPTATPNSGQHNAVPG